MFYVESLRNELDEIMGADSRVYVIGEDIHDPYGGAFKITKGLSTKYPHRVLTTPISEAGIVGVGTGLALRGLRPVVEIMFGDFVTLVGYSSVPCHPIRSNAATYSSRTLPPYRSVARDEVSGCRVAGFDFGN